MREDAAAAHRLCEAIDGPRRERVARSRSAEPGRCMGTGDYDRIRRSVRLFVPIISANTERRTKATSSKSGGRR